jgi:hypothetical protein
LCANVTQDFKDQRAAILTANTQGSANDASEPNPNILDSIMSTQTLEIVTRIENSVVAHNSQVNFLELWTSVQSWYNGNLVQA